MSVPGTLYLIPVPISDTPVSQVIPAFNLQQVKRLKYFVAEDAKMARAFLKSCEYPVIADASIGLLNEHNYNEDVSALLAPLLAGHDLGLMSDAGCPGVADPGAQLVALAHKRQITVMPLVGPSSILLAVMSSGFNGQNFAFNGYLPVDRAERQKRIRELEQRAIRTRQAQFFIETPYRNQQMLESLVAALQPSTRLYVGCDLLGPAQKISCYPCAEWKKMPAPPLHKVPAVFGIFV